MAGPVPVPVSGVVPVPTLGPVPVPVSVPVSGVVVGRLVNTSVIVAVDSVVATVSVVSGAAIDKSFCNIG